MGDQEEALADDVSLSMHLNRPLRMREYGACPLHANRPVASSACTHTVTIHASRRIQFDMHLNL